MKNMKISSLFCFMIVSILFCCQNAFSYEAASIHGPKFIGQRQTSDKLKGKLYNAVALLEAEGKKAFPEISKMNDNLKGNFGIFVIDPISGKLEVSPHKEKLGEYPLISKDLNGKVLAREIIKNEKLRDNEGFLNWMEHAYGLVYRNYFAKLAITPIGKLYVVAIGKNSGEMQKLFVTELVDTACELMQKEGLEKAIKVFNDKNSMFRFEDTYIFVYDNTKENRGVMLCNPNYPQYVGTNRLKEASKYLADNEKFYKVIDDHGEGWIQDMTKNPITDKDQLKDVYVKCVDVEGKSYIVGSGVYVYSDVSE